MLATGPQLDVNGITLLYAFGVVALTVGGTVALVRRRAVNRPTRMQLRRAAMARATAKAKATEWSSPMPDRGGPFDLRTRKPELVSEDVGPARGTPKQRRPRPLRP